MKIGVPFVATLSMTVKAGMAGAGTVPMRRKPSDPDPTPGARPANVTPIRPKEVQLTGIIGRPQFRHVNGKSLWSAGIGVSNGTGGTTWHNVVAWGNLAEYAHQHLHRGELIQVVGREKQESFVGQDGVMRHKTTFVTRRFIPANDQGSTTTR